MALTITQQMNMINGTVKPPSNLLIDLVHQSAMKYGKDFSEGYTVFSIVNNSSVAINANAENYVTRMLSIANRVFNADQSTVHALKRIIVTIIGSSSITYAQVTGALDTDWESTIATHMPRAFELLAGVTKREIANYASPTPA